MEKIETNEIIEEHEEKERIVVVPGEVLETGFDFLPGEGTRRENKEIVASKYGLLDKNEKIIKVIPLSGAFIPRTGNTVIGVVTDITFNGWLIDVGASSSAFLPIIEYYSRVNKNNLAEKMDFGDAVFVKIRAVKSRSVELTMRERGLKKLDPGLIIKINPTRVPRIIGRAGSMIKVIKDETGCNVLVGQNGVVWIKGDNPQSELLAKEAIDEIVAKPFVNGLTDHIQEFLKKKKSK